MNASIAIDGRYIFNFDGMGQYTRQLVKGLSINPNLEKHIFLNRSDQDHILPDSFNQIHNIIYGERAYYEKLYFPIEVKHRNINVFHCPHNFGLPLKAKCKKILTVHDIIPYFFELERSLCRFPDKKDYLKLIKKNTHHADLILADSMQTKQDLIEHVKVSESKIKVLYPAIPDEFKKKSENEINDLKKRYSIDQEYILFNGGIYYRKNIQRLVKAFKKCQFEGYLVIPGVGKEQVLKECLKDENLDKIKVLGFVSFDDLVTLYSGAKMLVYPSLYEGFGYPIVEAFACGCPVITSNFGSMSEIAGDAALLVDPYNIDDISNAIDKVNESDELRKDLIEKGDEQQNKFKITQFQMKVNEIYNEFVSQNVFL